VRNIKEERKKRRRFRRESKLVRESLGEDSHDEVILQHKEKNLHSKRSRQSIYRIGKRAAVALLLRETRPSF